MTTQLRISRDWAFALGFGALGLILRLWNLASPKGKIFDEVYYATNAQSLLQNGVEIDSKTGLAQFIVHPPTGKWLITIGIKLFGYNEFGWRFAAALIGSLSIVLMYFTAKKLFNNQLLSVFAAALISMDGLHLVHSRIALLDIFLLFFIQIAVLALLHQKYWLSAIALGLATSVKWSGLYVLIVFALLVLIMDYRKHRYLGSEKPIRQVIDNFPIRFLQFGIAPALIYLSSWIGWFLTNNGWSRNWSANPLRSLWHYHSEILNFHAKLSEPHPYDANPWSWLIMARPTSFFYESPQGCESKNCAQEVLAIGTPILWWIGTIAIAIVLGFWLRSVALKRFECVPSIVILGMSAGYLPWFFFQERTVFTFYAVIFEPFVILAIIYCAKLLLNSSLAPGTSISIVGGLIVLVFLNFIYFLPLFTGEVIDYSEWLKRMWFSSWI